MSEIYESWKKKAKIDRPVYDKYGNPVEDHDTEEFFRKYDANELSEEEITKGFQNLINTGYIWLLGGRFAKIAKRMIEEGRCKKNSGFNMEPKKLLLRKKKSFIIPKGIHVLSKRLQTIIMDDLQAHGDFSYEELVSKATERFPTMFENASKKQIISALRLLIKKDVVVQNERGNYEIYES